MKDFTPLRSSPAVGATPKAYAEQGVVAQLGACLPDWCKVTADGHKGWALKTEIWGVDIEELRE